MKGKRFNEHFTLPNVNVDFNDNVVVSFIKGDIISVHVNGNKVWYIITPKTKKSLTKQESLNIWEKTGVKIEYCDTKKELIIVTRNYLKVGDVKKAFEMIDDLGLK